MPKEPPRKPDNLPVKKPAAPKPVERLQTTSLESIGATLEEEKEEKKDAKPAAKGGVMSTVIGVPALPTPAEVPNVDKPKDDKPNDDKAAKPSVEKPAEKPGEQKSTIIGMPAIAPLPLKRAPEPESEPPAPAPRIPTPEPLPALPTSSLQGKLREILDGPRPRLYMFAGIAGAVVLIFLGVVIRLIRGSPSERTDTAASASVASSVLPPAVSSEAPVAAPPPPAKIPVCTASRASKVIAPRGVVAAGLELGIFDGAIALGWASGPKDASIATIDPATASASNTTHLTAVGGTLKRVIPRMPANTSILDIDGQAPRPIGAYEITSSGGSIVAGGKPLWKLESDAPAEALRGAVTSDGIVVAYRHAGAIWAGATKGMDSAAPPVRVAGLGPQIGSPAIAASGVHVIVAWADRAEASQPWGLRYFTWTLGEAPKPAESFPLPENSMAPSLTSLGGGFLLVWTEGPTDHQQVRVRVLGFDGKPSGEAMTVSPEGVHSGQGQAAVLPDGRGVVAFLSDTGKAFDVRATTMRCN